MKNTIPAVDKTLHVLELLSTGALGQTELAKRTGASTSTCYRILQTLLSRRWVIRDESGRYALSTVFFMMSKRSPLAMFEGLEPLMVEVSQKSGLACKISVRQGGEQVTILRVDSPLGVGFSFSVGARFPLIEGTVGAALLSKETDETLELLRQRCHSDIVEVREPGLLERRVATVRKDGYVLSERETRWKINAISAPLHGEGGLVVAALTLIGNAKDFEQEHLPFICRELKTTVRHMEARLS